MVFHKSSFIQFFTITIILCIVISQTSLSQDDNEAVIDNFFRGGHTNNWAVLVEYQSMLSEIYLPR